jgi:hypothetical protein
MIPLLILGGVILASFIGALILVNTLISVIFRKDKHGEDFYSLPLFDEDDF